jgi:hypothetical protein
LVFQQLYTFFKMFYLACWQAMIYFCLFLSSFLLQDGILKNIYAFKSHPFQEIPVVLRLSDNIRTEQ